MDITETIGAIARAASASIGSEGASPAAAPAEPAGPPPDSDAAVGAQQVGEVAPLGSKPTSDESKIPAAPPTPATDPGTESSASADSAIAEAAAGIADAAAGAEGIETPELTDQERIDASIDVIEQSPTGKRLLERAEEQGVRVIWDKPGADNPGATYYAEDRTIRLSDGMRDADPEEIAGILAHEYGHFAVDDADLHERALDDLPHEIGNLSDEIIAEALAVQIGEELGMPRRGTGVANDDGSIRSLPEAIDHLQQDDFYVDYYDLDTSNLSDEDRQRIRDVTAYYGNELLERYGDVPDELRRGVPTTDPIDRRSIFDKVEQGVGGFIAEHAGGVLGLLG